MKRIEFILESYDGVPFTFTIWDYDVGKGIKRMQSLLPWVTDFKLVQQ